MIIQKNCFLLAATFFLSFAANLFTPAVQVEISNPETEKTVAEIKAETERTVAEKEIKPEIITVTETKEEDGALPLLSAEAVWTEEFSNLMDGEMTAQKQQALEMLEKRNLALMSSSTEHIVNYHGRRFAITEDDYQVLLQIVQAEAGGEDIKGRMLVANVVLNRLEIGFGGDTISEVVFAKGQFSPIADGRFFEVTPDATTIKAVERVLNGEDESQGALYFMCRSLASKKGIRWFDKNLEFLFEHGCHEFFTEKE